MADLVRDGHIAPPLSTRTLAGGRTNRVWLLSGPDQNHVLKLYVPGGATALFPNDPDAELACLTHLHGTGLAPHLCASGRSPAGRWLLYDYLDGSPWRTDVTAVARRLADLHKLPPIPGLRTAPNGSAALTEQTLTYLRHCTGPDADHLRQIGPDYDIPPATDLALLHGDPVPGNILQTASGLSFIDWQCPAIGEPCEDIALFLSPGMQHLYRGAPLSTAETDAFLTAYAHPRITDRYTRLRPWYHSRMAAYCLWRGQTGNAAYAPAHQLETEAFKHCTPTEISVPRAASKIL